MFICLYIQREINWFINFLGITPLKEDLRHCEADVSRQISVSLETQPIFQVESALDGMVSNSFILRVFFFFS